MITATRERALEQADRMDAEAKAGKFRGPLHGIPYGAKDLFAVPKYPTTWGSPIYKDQVLDVTAAVVEKLDAAGAVLVAKTSLGEFAQNDGWFGGQTKNPWNTSQGSSGSSAGSASGVAAGLYPFAIGTETQGSIISPSTQCGVSGLRPTYGRVSRFGAMALSWTMDKVGPIARSAEDLALVFAAIHGADPRDPSTREHAVRFRSEPAACLDPDRRPAEHDDAAGHGGDAGRLLRAAAGAAEAGVRRPRMANYQANKAVARRADQAGRQAGSGHLAHRAVDECNVANPERRSRCGVCGHHARQHRRSGPDPERSGRTPFEQRRSFPRSTTSSPTARARC